MPELDADGTLDVVRLVFSVRDVFGAQASMRASAYVNHRRTKKRTLLDSGGRIADHAGRHLEQRDEFVDRQVGYESRLPGRRIMMFAEMAERLGHLAGARVRVGPEPEGRHVNGRDGPERRLQMLAIRSFGRHRMLNDGEERPRD